jgi:hypothetical protein
VVDIEQDGVKLPAWLGRIESLAFARRSEEIGMDQTTPRITCEFVTQRHEPFLVPFDNGGKRIHNQERGHFAVLERSGRCIAKPEPTHYNVP